MFKWLTLIFAAITLLTVYQQHTNQRRGLRIQAYAYSRGGQWHGKDALGRDVAFERVGNDLYVNGSWYGRVVEER